jgi:hypothetical protein
MSTPMRRMCSRCCPRAASGHAAALPSSVMRIVFGVRGYWASRIAWFYMTGEWPSGFVDHKNRDPLDDRWHNLRLASHGQNRANSRSTAVSGFKGAYKRGRRYQAMINDGTCRHLGMFDNAEDANAAYEAEARKVWGEYARAR